MTSKGSIVPALKVFLGGFCWRTASVLWHAASVPTKEIVLLRVKLHCSENYIIPTLQPASVFWSIW